MRVAIIHDWLVGIGAAERVLEQLLLIWPDADVYTTVDRLAEEDRHILGDARVHTSFLQTLSFGRGDLHRQLPMMPLAMEQFDLSGYDLVLSNSHTVAKGVLTSPEQVHVCYLMSPMGFAWDRQSQYLRDQGLERGVRGWLARINLHRLRTWDFAATARVDSLIAISRYTARRAEATYRRRTDDVVAGPVDLDYWRPASQENRQDYYLAASRLLPAKRLDLLVDAFAAMPDRRLVIVGDGPEAARLATRAGPNVTLLGAQPDDILRHHMRAAQAFLFAASEDFPMVTAEALACGCPVIAYGRGAALEIVRGLDAGVPTGVFFPTQDPSAVVEAIEKFEVERNRFTSTACRSSVGHFAADTFRARIASRVSDAMGRLDSEPVRLLPSRTG